MLRMCVCVCVSGVASLGVGEPASPVGVGMCEAWNKNSIVRQVGPGCVATRVLRSPPSIRLRRLAPRRWCPVHAGEAGWGVLGGVGGWVAACGWMRQHPNSFTSSRAGLDDESATLADCIGTYPPTATNHKGKHV